MFSKTVANLVVYAITAAAFAAPEDLATEAYADYKDTLATNAVCAKLEPKIDSKIEMPDELVPVGRVLARATNGVEWVFHGGTLSLGNIVRIRDTTNGWHDVRAELNPSGQMVVAVDQEVSGTNDLLTVEEERDRAMAYELQNRFLVTNEIVRAITNDLELSEKIKAIGALGRFLSTWNTATGRPATEPKEDVLEYMAGDYYIVGAVPTNGTHLIPNGTVYHRGQSSTTSTTNDIAVNDVFRHADDGGWALVHMLGVSTTFGQLAGSPRDNMRLANELDNAGQTVSFDVTRSGDEWASSLRYDEIRDTLALGKVMFVRVMRPSGGEPRRIRFSHSNAARNSFSFVEQLYGEATNTLLTVRVFESTVDVTRVEVTESAPGVGVSKVALNGDEYGSDGDGVIHLPDLATSNALAAVAAELAVETNRAQVAETNLCTAITNEAERAYVAETNLAALIVAEYDRATNAEHNVAFNATNYTDGATNEIMVAITNLEEKIYAEIKAEYDRATNAELFVATTSTNYTDIATNAVMIAVTNLEQMIYAETNRAYAAETNLYTMVTNKQNKLAFGIDDEGKVLGVHSNKLAWIDGGSSNVAWGGIVGSITNQNDLYTALTNKQDKLPKVTSGKVGYYLRAKDKNGGLEWGTELPSIGSFANEGKFLRAGVSNKCSWAWTDRIQNGTGAYIASDLNAMASLPSFTDWFPESHIVFNLLDDSIKYDTMHFTNGVWKCKKWTGDGYTWSCVGTVEMDGDKYNERALTLVFPTGQGVETTRYITYALQQTKVAVTNDIAAKQDRLPTSVPGTYLHTSADGELEWTSISVISNAEDATWIRSDGEAALRVGKLGWNPKVAFDYFGTTKFIVSNEFNEAEGCWMCSAFASDGSGGWVYSADYQMQGTYYDDPNATILSFPGGLTTTEKNLPEVGRTRIATTNDLLNSSGTRVTLNGVDKTGATASFYAPTSWGTSGRVLKSSGQNASPTWAELSKSDVGLGNVVNTGDSATPVSGGTTKFTTGGAYTELAKKVTVDSTYYSALTRQTLWNMNGGARTRKVIACVTLTAAESPTGSASDSFSATIDANNSGAYGKVTLIGHGGGNSYMYSYSNGTIGAYERIYTSKGGLLTGQILLSPTSGGGNGIDCSNNTGLLNISAGTDSPKIYMRGGAKESSAGVIDIIAQKPSASKTLTLNPNGSFTWGGKNVAVATSDTTSDWTQLISGNTSIKYRKYNGMVYVWLYGYATTGTAEYSAGTLPAGYRPAFNMPGVFRSLGSTTTLLIIVSPNGVLNVEPGGVSVGTGFYGMLYFPSASN